MLCISPPEQWVFVFLSLEKKNRQLLHAIHWIQRVLVEYFILCDVLLEEYSSDDQFLERDLYIIVRAR